MSQPLIEEPTYFQINEITDNFIKQINQLSQNMKIVVILEDQVNSIIKQAPQMVMSDTLGLLHLSLIRLDQHERQSFVDRVEAGKKLEQNREAFVNDQAKNNKFN